MIAVVLVGGEGTRLRPLTLDRPKPMLPIANRPFLAYLFDRLIAAGVGETVLSCGYLSDPIVAGTTTTPAAAGRASLSFGLF